MRISVVGAGLIGLSCAWRLVRDGHRVCVFDSSAEPREASWAAAGMLAPHHEADHDSPLWRLCAAGLERWPGFLQELGMSPRDADWRDGGGWIRATDLADLDRLEASLRWLRATGTDVLRLSAGAYARACSVAAPGVGALWLPGAQVDPRLVWPRLRAACLAAGVTERLGAPVTAIAEGSLALADGSTHASDAVLLASGAWTPALAALTGTQLPGAPVKGQMIRLPGPCHLRGFIRQDHRYLMSRHDGSVVVGATMVEAGFDRALDPSATSALAAWAGDAVPALAAQTPSEAWTGLRPRLASGLPAIGRVRQGLWVATGHFRNGVLLAPITGDLIADLVGGRQTAALSFDPVIAGS
jgi:glycine oxidase